MNITEWASIRCEQTQLLAAASAPFHLQNSFIWGRDKRQVCYQQLFMITNKKKRPLSEAILFSISKQNELVASPVLAKSHCMWIMTYSKKKKQN